MSLFCTVFRFVCSGVSSVSFCFCLHMHTHVLTHTEAHSAFAPVCPGRVSMRWSSVERSLQVIWFRLEAELGTWIRDSSGILQKPWHKAKKTVFFSVKKLDPACTNLYLWNLEYLSAVFCSNGLCRILQIRKVQLFWNGAQMGSASSAWLARQHRERMVQSSIPPSVVSILCHNAVVLSPTPPPCNPCPPPPSSLLPLLHAVAASSMVASSSNGNRMGCGGF